VAISIYRQTMHTTEGGSPFSKFACKSLAGSRDVNRFWRGLLIYVLTHSGLLVLGVTTTSLL